MGYRYQLAASVQDVNLFDFVLDYLRARKLLEPSLKVQRTRGDEALLKALKGVLSEEKLAGRFGEAVAIPGNLNNGEERVTMY